ncbi:MAG: NAD(P)H-binding protein, partial [Bacteroidota bacterium]
MKTILITGATGNVGFEVVRFLSGMSTDNKIVAGVRNIEKAKGDFKDYPDLGFVYFDFENPETFESALTGIDRVFLLRPPHISNVEKYFRPLISHIRNIGIREVLFLSVQGAEKSKVIPHNKIERLIMEDGPDYIFLRPGYFMQNLTTT